MAIVIEDRPIESVREQVIDQLIMNYSHGQISHEAFERRLDEAMAAACNKVLIALTEDLELVVDDRYRETKKQDFGTNYVPGETEDVDYMINIFSGSKRGGQWKVAKEIKMLSIFSGADLDFSDALFTHPVVRIKSFSLFSGDNIYVPENINVISKAFCVFGSIDNSAPSNADKNAPTLIVEGLAIFSGVDIKVKRTMKEKFVAFADGLKNMFS